MNSNSVNENYSNSFLHLNENSSLNNLELQLNEKTDGFLTQIKITESDDVEIDSNNKDKPTIVIDSSRSILDDPNNNSASIQVEFKDKSEILSQNQQRNNTPVSNLTTTPALINRDIFTDSSRFNIKEKTFLNEEEELIEINRITKS